MQGLPCQAKKGNLNIDKSYFLLKNNPISAKLNKDN